MVAWKFGIEVWVVAEARLGSDLEAGLAEEAMNWALQSDSAESFLHRIDVHFQAG